MTTPSPDYEVEAGRYDETRGGLERAAAAAVSVAALLPRAGLLLDVGGGTGLVARCLVGHGWRPVVLDRSAAMLGLAARRLPGRVVRGDALLLPLRDASVDAALALWLLHLLPDARPVLAECARVLRPGGVLVTTVDKALAHGYLRVDPRSAPDARHRVLEQGAALGLEPVGETAFVGHGQGRDGGHDPVYPLLALRRATSSA